MTMTPAEIMSELNRMFPNAGCELDYETVYQLAVAVILSAQTTDKAVNEITPALFARFPDAVSLASGEVGEIEKYIKRIGLFRNKAKNLKGFAEELTARFDSVLPRDSKELQSLPGIGRKTANVIQAVGFQIPALAVDTHVERVSHRLALVSVKANLLQTELTLKKKIPENQWIQAHHTLLFFGRYKCKALRPLCDDCPFTSFCRYQLQKNRNQLK